MKICLQVACIIRCISIFVNNFRAFSAHENIFTMKKANYSSSELVVCVFPFFGAGSDLAVVLI